MSAELRSLLIGTITVDVLLAGALILTLSRAPAWSNVTARRRLANVFAAAIGVQAVHFFEEWATGFHERWPALLGLVPWPASLWVSFNLVWFTLWGLALVGLRARWRAALVPIWLLALACAVNGVAHPLLALAVGGYFPGLWSSPLCGLTAVVFLRRLGAFSGPAAAVWRPSGP
jgi:hypothetical protein